MQLADPYLALWYSARDHTHGVWVRTPDPHRLKQKLYQVRGTDPFLQDLQLRTSPIDPLHEVWIVNVPKAA